MENSATFQWENSECKHEKFDIRRNMSRIYAPTLNIVNLLYFHFMRVLLTVKMVAYFWYFNGKVR